MTEGPTSQGSADQPVVAGPAPDSTPRSRGPIIAVSVGALVLIVGGIALAIRMAIGSDLGALEAIPADADVVITLDLLQLTDSERIDSLIKTFTGPLEDAGHIDSSEVDLAGQIDEALQEEFGLTLEEDILPWVGRSVAAGIWIPPDFDDSAEPEVLLSMSIRDTEGAAKFIRTVGDPVEEEPLEGGTLYVPTGAEEPVVIWVGDDHLVMAQDRSTLLDGLASRSGRSLLDDETFSETVSRLPTDRIAAVYIGPTFFEVFADAMAEAAPEEQFDLSGLEELRGLAFSVGLPDAGLRFDVVQLLDEDASQAPIASGDLAGVAALPVETIGYAGFTIGEGYIEEFLDQLRQADPDAYDEVATDIEEEIGVDVFGEVLPSIGGENLIAVVKDRDGFVAEESELPLGFLASIGLADTAPMTDLLTALEPFAIDEDIQIMRGTPTVAWVEGSELLAYQVTDDALAVGTSSSLLEAFLDGAGGLTESSLYQEINAELPGDDLAVYVDLGQVFDLIEMNADDRAIVDPLRGIGGSYVVVDDSVTGSLLIMIDYLSE